MPLSKRSVGVKNTLVLVAGYIYKKILCQHSVGVTNVHVFVGNRNKNALVVSGSKNLTLH